MVVVVEGMGDRRLQAISFLMIKLGKLSREGRIPEIIWLIKGKPLFIFWKKGDCHILCWGASELLSAIAYAESFILGFKQVETIQ